MKEYKQIIMNLTQKNIFILFKITNIISDNTTNNTDFSLLGFAEIATVKDEDSNSDINDLDGLLKVLTTEYWLILAWNIIYTVKSKRWSQRSRTIKNN